MGEGSGISLNLVADFCIAPAFSPEPVVSVSRIACRSAEMYLGLDLTSSREKSPSKIEKNGFVSSGFSFPFFTFLCTTFVSE